MVCSTTVAIVANLIAALTNSDRQQTQVPYFMHIIFVIDVYIQFVTLSLQINFEKQFFFWPDVCRPTDQLCTPAVQLSRERRALDQSGGAGAGAAGGAGGDLGAGEPAGCACRLYQAAGGAGGEKCKDFVSQVEALTSQLVDQLGVQIDGGVTDVQVKY